MKHFRVLRVIHLYGNPENNFIPKPVTEILGRGDIFTILEEPRTYPDLWSDGRTFTRCLVGEEISWVANLGLHLEWKHVEELRPTSRKLRSKGYWR